MSDKLRSEVTKSRPRDEKGHFVSVPKQKDENLFAKFLSSHTGHYKNEDDLLDIHIGNPFRRIVALLEDIKKQKAFSFTFKGSLGIAGVILVLSVFGILGGNKLVCDKGTQTQIGTIRVLEAKEIYERKIPFLSYLLELVSPSIKEIKNRVVLIKSNETVIALPFSDKVDFSSFKDKRVVATGKYDVCSDTLFITDQNAIELLVKTIVPSP